MPKTLDELITDLRAEIGDSTNAAMGIEAAPGLRRTLQRIQETLWLDYDWPQLEITREEAIEAGQRYATFHEDVDFSRISKAWFRDGMTWRELDPGITPEHYNCTDSDGGQTGTPARWNHHEEDQFEIWPVPAVPTRVRFECIRRLKPFAAGTDACSLDGTLLVLYAAAELLARSKSEDAPMKLQQAQKHYLRLKGANKKGGMFVMGGGVRTAGPKFRIPR